MKRIILPLLFLCLSLLTAEAQESTGFIKSFDGTKIYYEVIGTGKPVILIHGFIVNSESWKRTHLYKDLPDAGYQVILVDLRGNGKSDKPHKPEAYERDAEAKDVMRIADHLKLDAYTVVGYSRGSIIASRLLVLDKRVHPVVMGGMGDGFIDPNWPRRKMFYEAFADTTNQSHQELQTLLKFVKDTGLDRLALTLMQKAQPHTSKAEFDHIKKPVLVICGDQDDDNGSAKELASFIHHSTYETVPGFHHDANHTREFSDAIIKYLDHHTKR